MQKISSYLYPNRIFVVVDLASYQTEWNIVYQRPLKIYKGVSNVIEFDFKNAQQKRIDISSYAVKCIVMDQTNLEVCTIDVVPTTITGIATATVPASVVNLLQPQFLKYSLYLETGDSTRLPVYADTQFGVLGQMELVGDVFPSTPVPVIIDTFLSQYISQTEKIYRSEAANILPNNVISNTYDPTSLAFEFDALDGTVTVQVSSTLVISADMPWTTIDTFQVTNTTQNLTTQYTRSTNFKEDVIWLRVTYTPVAGTTGKVDKVAVS